MQIAITVLLLMLLLCWWTDRRALGRMTANDSDSPKRRWYQFSLEAMVLATFWASISMAAWVLDETPRFYTTPWIVLWIVRALGPFIAVGTLFGRAKMGLLIGIAFGAASVIVGVLHWTLTYSG